MAAAQNKIAANVSRQWSCYGKALNVEAKRLNEPCVIEIQAFDLRSHNDEIFLERRAYRAEVINVPRADNHRTSDIGHNEIKGPHGVDLNIHGARDPRLAQCYVRSGRGTDGECTLEGAPRQVEDVGNDNVREVNV